MIAIRVPLDRSTSWRLRLRPDRYVVLRPVHRPRRSTSSTGAGLLAEMITEGADREDVAKRMREAEHICDENTHAIVRRVNSSFVTPFDREDIYSLASGLDDVMDDHGRGRRPDPALRGRATSRPSPHQVEVIQRCAEITADAMPKLRTMTGPRRVLDRDQPPRERRRQELPPYPRQAVQRRLQGDRGAQAQGHRQSLEGAIDAFEKVANIVEQIAVKES